MQRDPYLYSDVNVLKNKLGIKDKTLLSQFENDITYINLISVDQCLNGKPLDLEHLEKIHKHIFGDIFEWAGEIRTIGISKGEVVLGGDTVRYSSPSDIVKDANKAIKELHNQDWKSLVLDDKAIIFSRIIASLWQAHPFREGNTRSVITYACHFAGQNGFQLDRSVFRDNSSYTRNALVCASDGRYAKYGYFQGIMKGAMIKGAESACKNEIQKAGFNPTEELIKRLMSLNNHFNVLHSVKEVKDMYQKINMLKDDEKLILKSLVDEFKKEEMKNHPRKNTIELEM